MPIGGLDDKSTYKMTNKEQLIYLAGLADGEGCLTGSFSKDRFRARFAIDNTHNLVLQWVKLLFGGNIYKYPARGYGRKQTYVWILVTNRATKLVECLLPFLKIKKKEAEVFVQFKGASKEKRSQIDKELKRLKR